MTYTIKLLAAALAALLLSHLLTRRLLSPEMPEGQYKRAMTLLAASAVISFISMKVVVLLTILTVLLVVVAIQERDSISNRIAVFLLVAVAFPPIGLSIDNVGDIRQLIVIRPTRIAAIVLLIPAIAQLLANTSRKRPPWLLWVDSLLVAFYVLKIGLSAPQSTTTLLVRTVVEFMIDTLIPYYVISRGLRSAVEIRNVLAWLSLATVYAACVAVLEFGWQKNIYSELQGVYGVTWQLTFRIFRGGLLRTQAMAPQPIVLGFILVFGAACLSLFVMRLRKYAVALPVLTLTFAAVLSTSARGPLVGAMVFCIVLWALHGGNASRFRWGLAAALAAAITLRVAGLDGVAVNAVAGLLGGGSQGLQTVDYRQELLDTALALIRQSPWLGVPDHAAYMEHLRQGEGIIDMVNSFLAITLDAGIVGLVLYLGPFVLIANRLLNHLYHPENCFGAPLARFANVFVALTCASLVMIFTTSTFGAMPYLLLLLICLPIAWLRLIDAPPDENSKLWMRPRAR